MEIRPYEESDWDALADIHDRARVDELRLTVGEEAFLSLEDTAVDEGLFDGELWVAADEGTPAGFVAFKKGAITWLYVDPDRTRRGIGRALLRHALERCGDEVEVSVLEGNDPAIALYEGEGFVITESRAGRLVGNDSFSATGHTMIHSNHRQAGET
jgi:ribosomal protein S18 acetylase RimI-like enzyme